MRVKEGWEGIVVGLIMLAVAMVLIVGANCSSGRRTNMAKVGRVVTDPKAGSYCRITLNSGDRILVSHGTGRGGGGSVTIEEVRWWGFVPGATVFTCDLESAQGQRLWARLVEGAPPGSARATPLRAVVEYVKRCRSLGEVTAACEALVSSGPESAA